jgi:hypothetical protein
MKLRTVMNLCISIMMMLCLVSCVSVRLSVPIKPLDVAPLVDKIPLKAALYLSPSYKAAQAPIGTRNGGIIGSAFVGDALCDASEKMAKNIFQDVVMLDQMGNTSDSHYDVIIAPQLVKFEYEFAADMISGHYKIQNTVKWVITTPDGKEIYQNTVSSDKITLPRRCSREMWFSETTKTIKDQIQKAQNDIYSNGWWKNPWWKKN